MSQKEVNIPYRECKIMYEVDGQSIAQLAAHFGIEWSDMKQALRDYGFTTRKTEKQPEAPAKSYVVVLVDKDKIAPKEAKKAAVVQEA